jgi:hypothetical protein
MRRPSFSNVVSPLAPSVALGGTSLETIRFRPD